MKKAVAAGILFLNWRHLSMRNVIKLARNASRNWLFIIFVTGLESFKLFLDLIFANS